MQKVQLLGYMEDNGQHNGHKAKITRKGIKPTKRK